MPSSATATFATARPTAAAINLKRIVVLYIIMFIIFSARIIIIVKMNSNILRPLMSKFVNHFRFMSLILRLMSLIFRFMNHGIVAM